MTNSMEDKLQYAAVRARELEAEKHYYDAGRAQRCPDFSVHYRAPGHWDIMAAEVPGRASAWRAAHGNSQTSAKDGQTERAFRIRGEPGNVLVFDERWNPHVPHPRQVLLFRSMSAAVLWVTEEMMAP